MSLSSKNNLSKNGLELTYYKHGKGSKSVITFHGFGQDHSTFERLLDNKSDDIVFYHFDLPFHGDSYHLPEGKAIEPDIFHSLFSSFLENHQIAEFSIIAFSIGAKPAISLLYAFNARIKELFFISPEGISINIWYNMATGNQIGRWLFNLLMKNRFPVTTFLNAFSKTLNLNKSIVRYLENQFQSTTARKQIVNSWLSLRKFKWNRKLFLTLLNQDQIKVILITGNKDEIANTSYLQKLEKESDKINLSILEGNHFSILKIASAYISEYLNE